VSAGQQEAWRALTEQLKPGGVGLWVGESVPRLEQAEVNARVWRTGNHLAEYANRVLQPVEVMILARYREVLSGRVLEVGCGAGRVLGYLVALGGEVHGIDISQTMVEYCRRTYPGADVRRGDLGALTASEHAPFDAVLATYNVLDVLDDAQRRRVLGEMRSLLGPAGLLIFSSHNLAHVDREREAAVPAPRRRRALELLSKLVGRPPVAVAQAAIRTPLRMRNRRRLGDLERRAADHAILNDVANDYGVLHYYIRRDDQERQLQETGYELVECLDLEDHPVVAGEDGCSPWLHYVARPIASPDLERVDA